MGELETLLARCEAATGNDMTLLADIYLALFPDMGGINSGFDGIPLSEAAARYRKSDPEYWPVVTHTYPMEDILSSIDAALALVERLLPEWGHQVGRPIQTYVNGYYASVFKEGEYFHDWKPVANEIRPRDSYRPNGAIAVVIALLRTLIARRMETT